MRYSIDFRRKVMLIRQQEGLTSEETAKGSGVGKMSVLRWSKGLESKTHRKKACVTIDMKALKEDIQTYQDAYYYERAKRWGVSASGVFKGMKRLGITFKKNSWSSQGQRRTAYFLSKDTSLSRSWQDHCLPWWVRLRSWHTKNPRLCFKRTWMLWQASMGGQRANQYHWCFNW